jgi:hypothetical protein
MATKTIICSQNVCPEARSPREHCRICGYTPRPQKLAKPYWSFEKIIDHMESRHPALVYEFRVEWEILLTQQHGDDSRCQFHKAVQP